MADPATLTASAVRVRGPEVLEAIINDDAAAPSDLVRCEIPSFGNGWVTDPSAWMPYVTGVGVFYPKRGDRAKVSANGDGSGVVLAWWPAATIPDVSF